MTSHARGERIWRILLPDERHRQHSSANIQTGVVLGLGLGLWLGLELGLKLVRSEVNNCDSDIFPFARDYSTAA